MKISNSKKQLAELVAACEALGAVLSTAGIEPVAEAKPTIEQLAADYRNAKDYADRKQQEADAAKADAEAKLAELVAAGKALGLVLSVAGVEPELVITDWRDLQVGDVIQCVGDAWDNDFDGREAVVTGIEDHEYKYEHRIRARIGDESDWGCDFIFIRRQAKGDANA